MTAHLLLWARNLRRLVIKCIHIQALRTRSAASTHTHSLIHTQFVLEIWTCTRRRRMRDPRLRNKLNKLLRKCHRLLIHFNCLRKVRSSAAAALGRVPLLLFCGEPELRIAIISLKSCLNQSHNIAAITKTAWNNYNICILIKDHHFLFLQ